MLAVSCAKKSDDYARPEDHAKDEVKLDEVSALGLACMSIYYNNNAVRAKEILLKYIEYLDKANIDASDKDTVFSNKALALARLEYINRYLSGTKIDWDQPVAALKKTSPAKDWSDERAVFYMKSIIMQDAKHVAWINGEEIRQSLPADWLPASDPDRVINSAIEERKSQKSQK